MDIKEKSNVNKAIGAILNCYVGSLNGPETRKNIAYDVKTYLENSGVNFEGVNVYTIPERIDDGLIDIKVDDELYPFSEIDKVDKNNWHDYIFKWESGSLEEKDVITLFQYLIDEGHAWSLQGFYGRTAEDLIEAGFCTLSFKVTIGHYIWGKPRIPTKYDLPKNAPGTDEYVQKRTELCDDEFIAWVGEQENE